jgi:hypothetical protein
MRRVLSPLLACVLLSAGCASTVNQTMQSWVGHNVQELMQSWGVPTQVMDNPAGSGKIVIYDFHAPVTLPGTAPTPGSSYTTGYIDANGNWQSTTTYNPGSPGTPSQTIDFQRVRVFYVNSEGTITSWSWRGL